MKILRHADGGTDVVIPYTCMGYTALLLCVLFNGLGLC